MNMFTLKKGFDCLGVFFPSEMTSLISFYITRCSEMKQRCFIGHKPYDDLFMCFLIKLWND